MALAKQNAKSNTPPPPQYISLSPDDFTQGGLIDDIDVEIIDAASCEWDYNGQQAAGPALAVQFQDPNGQTHDQYYSAGKAEDWSPSEDGHGFISVSGKTTVNTSSNLAKLFASMVEAGFPKELLASGDVKVIIGTKCHVNQVAQERKGLIRTGKNADRPSTTLLVTKIHSLPGADTKSPAKAAGKATTTTKAAGGKANGAAAATTAASGNADMDEAIVGALIAALGEADGPLPKKAMVQVVFKAFDADANLKGLRNKAIARVNAADFLKSLGDSGITFDGAQISLE
jgi:hypothetical protein